MSDDDLLYKLYLKHHLFAHLTSEADTNPRKGWNSHFESEIGDAASMATNRNVIYIRTHLIKAYRVAYGM